MAIYVLFQCCKCNSKRRIHLYSCSSNQYDIHSQLCEHFNIKYSYTCKWGFFTLGWKIIIEVKVQCRKCNHKYHNFGSITFNSDYYNIDLQYTCCYNVFNYSVNGYNYGNNGNGLLLQQKQKELEDAFNKGQQMKIQKEIERQQQIKKQEELKKQREIKKQQELKMQKEKNIRENIKINNIIEKQKKEEKEYDQLYQCNTDYIESELNNLIYNIDSKTNNSLNFNYLEKLNENIDFKIIKFELKN